MLSDPAAGTKRAKAALAGIERIKLRADHRSRLPSVTSPQEQLRELRDTLAVIAENGQIIVEGLPTPDDTRKETLRVKADTWLNTIAGGVEGHWLKAQLEGRPRP
jgi:hypothetical protein